MGICKLSFIFSSTLCILTAFSCGNTSSTTQELLNGSVLTKIYRPISLLSPSDSTPLSALPTLSWSNASPISNYRVQISALTDFSTLIVDKVVSAEAYTVQQADLIGITAFDGREYYWRVAGAANNVLMSSTGKLQFAETNVVYVNANTTSSAQSGNRTSPFKTISAGLAAADSRRGGNYNTAYTVRVAAGTYTEEITMIPGISLRGGYGVAAGSGSTPAGAASTDWVRNITVNVSTIQAPLNVAVNCNNNITAAYQATTVLDGFTVKGGSDISMKNIVVYINDSNPTIQNNIIMQTTTNNHPNNNHVLFSWSASNSNPLIQKNIIQGPPSGFQGAARPVMIQNTSGSLISNIIIGGNASGGGNRIEAVHLEAASATISNNIIHAGNTQSDTYGIFLQNMNAGNTVQIGNNTIYGGVSTNTATGIQFESQTSAPIVNVSYNIVFTGASASRYGMAENGSAPSTLNRNLVFDATTALFYLFTGSVMMNYVCGASFWTGVGCTGSQLTTPTGTNNSTTAGSTSAVFGSSFSVTSYKTWAILSAGPADIAGSAGWSGLGVDIGADAANAGPQ